MNSILFVLAVIASALPAQLCLAKGIKTRTLSDNEIGNIQLALGYSTLLQFDSRPFQVVVGDQDSFKVEQLGTSIAIKPLLEGVSTNLFVITSHERFSFKVTVGARQEPDYILKIKREVGKPHGHSTGLVTRVSGKWGSRRGITLKLLSVAATQSNSAVIYSFQLTGVKAASFLPGDFEVIQFGRSLPIDNIYLESLTLRKGGAVKGMMLVRMEHIRREVHTAVRFDPTGLNGRIQIPVSPI